MREDCRCLYRCLKLQVGCLFNKAKYLEKPQQGKGILLGGVAGVSPAKVVIIGGGIVGTEAAKMAAGLGANVFIFDINLNRSRVRRNFAS